MKNKLMQTVLGSMLSFLLVTSVMIGSAFGLNLDLVAEEATATMPDATSVTMWGLRDIADTSHTAGDWEIPVFTTSDAVLNINLTNNLPVDAGSTLAKPTSLIIPGLQASEVNAMVPTWTDGTTGPRGGDLTKRVRSLTREAANGGGSENYSWNLKPGTYLIQSGTHQAVQVQMGLFAVLVVHPATPNQAYGPSTPFTSEQTLVYSEIDTALHTAVATDDYGPGKTYTSTMDFNPDYYLINGQPFDETDLALDIGTPLDTILMRFINAGYETRVPVLQGNYFQLIAEDGNLLPFPQELYSLELPAGKTKDVLLTTPDQGLYSLYDARFNLTSAGVPGGGLLVKLSVDSPAAFGVISPNGGESLVAQSQETIDWGRHPDAESYELRYSVNGGSSWPLIDTPLATAGTSYNWTVPNVDSTTALVRVIVRGVGNQWLTRDDSDAVFSIHPPVPVAVTVLSPNGGETLAGQSTVTIDWVGHPDAVSYELRYSVNGGASWPLIDTPLATAGTSYNWTVPDVDSTTALVRVIVRGAGNQWLARDDSDAVFSIHQPGTVLYPNGGETLTGQSIETIDWVGHPDAESYELRYSVNGGASWPLIDTPLATAGTSYNWTVPNVDSTTVLVRVIRIGTGGAWLGRDDSDGAFEIISVP